MRIFASLLLLLFSLSVSGNEPPQRIVSLAPGFSETLIALGLTERIVGVTTSSDYLKELSSKKRVGLYMKPSLEGITALKPDLVFAAGYVGQEQVVRNLRGLGIRVETFSHREGLEGIFKMVERVGELCACPKKSDALIKEMRDTIAQIRQMCAGRERPRVYVEVGYNPLFSCGKGSFISELIEIAGGENIAGDVDRAYPRLSCEFIIRKNPQIIIFPYMGRNYAKEAIKKREGWREICAVREGRLYDDIGPQTITIPSPNLVLKGLPDLAERIHPEVFTDGSVHGSQFTVEKHMIVKIKNQNAK